MYIPKHFQSPDRALTLALMRENNFATLISSENSGAPYATHLPVVVSEEDERVVLYFHLARANPHVALLREKRASMVAFLGPHAYMSPKVYADLRHVPTWNYVAAHAYGEPTELAESDAKDAMLKSLIALHEPAYADQWRALDEAYQMAMLRAICVFRMQVTTLEGKFKLNQHREEADSAVKSAYANGTPNERTLAQWMERIGH